MPVYRAFLRTMGAAAFLAWALACGGGKKNDPVTPSTTATLSGTVTYVRVPLAKDANGVPTGLVDETDPTKLQSLPARGVQVRVYQQVEQTDLAGNKTFIWIIGGSGFTDSTGHYSLVVTKDRLSMVELQSSFDGAGGQRVNLIAEPEGITSLTPTTVLNRRLYALRKAADGQAPAGLNVPTSMLAGDTTLDFSVKLNDVWWLVDTDYNPSTGEAVFVTQAALETDLGHPVGTGSRVLGIGDTLASHVAIYGGGTPGTTLDLHYWPGRSEEPRGTYIEYDLSAPLYTSGQNLDVSRNQFHLFGSIRGDAANDDAWDEGILLPIFARNALYAQNASSTFAPPQGFPTPLSPLLPVATLLTDLSPDLARLEGLADVMAAAILKSPYLADCHGTSLAAPLKDIRIPPGAPSSSLAVYSAPAIRALGWEILLKANGIVSPGTPADWTKIDPLATQRFFAVPTPMTNSDGTSILEPFHIYAQIKRLQEAKSSAEPVDLAALFTDATLTPLLAPFGLPWPRPTAGPEALFRSDWGTDPNSTALALPPIAFTMGSAVQVNGAFPNVSKGEVVYAGFNLSADKRYVLSATISPALSAGATLELDILRLNRAFFFTGSGGSTSDPVVIPMNGTAPFFHPVRLRLKSPDAIQPDFTVTVGFTPKP